MTVRSIRLDTADEVRQKLGDRPAVLLSVSVPYERPVSADDSPEDQQAAAVRNAAYLRDAQYPRIRSAVLSITRALLLRKVRLVFGAHPSISPMVLDMARDVAALRAGLPPDSAGGPPRDSDPDVLIFQSRIFEGELPESTLELASWDAGQLVLTPPVAGANPTETRRQSVNRMRELMVTAPGLRAAIFIGGMEGVEEEARMFSKLARGKRMYAVASTGAAALNLWRQDQNKFCGTLRAPEMLVDSTCYSAVAADILADLNIQEPPVNNLTPAGGAGTGVYAPESPAVTSHMSMVQGIINRLAAASASCKTWCVTLVTSLAALAAATKNPAILVAALVPILVFGYLDAMYLAHERAYRGLFNDLVHRVRAGRYTREHAFEANVGPHLKSSFTALASWSVWPMYGGLLILYAVAFFNGLFGPVAQLFSR